MIGKVYRNRWQLVQQLESMASGVIYSVMDLSNKRNLIGKELSFVTRPEDFVIDSNYQSPYLDVPIPESIVSDDQKALIVYDLGVEASLAAELDFKTLTFEVGMKVVMQIATAISRLHSLGTFHGRLTPESCLILKDGSVALTESEMPWLWGGEAAYEWPYLDPFLSDFSLRSQSSDCYALGIIIYNIATGSLPFQVSSINDLKSRAPTLPPPIGKKASSWPARIFEIAQACTNLDQGKRIDSIERILLELQQIRSSPTLSTSISSERVDLNLASRSPSQINFSNPTKRTRKTTGITLNSQMQSYRSLVYKILDSTIFRLVMLALAIWLIVDLF